MVGAGAMSGLAVATLRRRGVGTVSILSRTLERAERLAASTGGVAHSMADLDAALVDADLVVCCAGAAGFLVHERDAKAALAVRVDRARHGVGEVSQVYLDLALPRDVDPDVAALDGALLVDLADLGRELTESAETGGVGGAVEQARALVHEEVTAFLSCLVTATEVGPTVVALRGMAASVMQAELDRLRLRLAGRAEPAVLAELEQTVHRVVDKLLHNPTVRIKQLAAEPDGLQYTQALRELFGLDPAVVTAVTEMAEPESGGSR